MPKEIDLENPKCDNYVHLVAALDSSSSRLLDRALNSDIDLDVVFKSSDNTYDTPLSYAVKFNNEEAVRKIFAKLKEYGPKILRTHLTYETFDTTLLHYAAYKGNPNVVKLLMHWGADVESFSGTKHDARAETPLMSAIRHLSSYSLIEEGDWGDKELKEKLRLWYQGKERFPEGATTKVTWQGNINVIIALLTKKGVDPTALDKNNDSPYSLVTSLTNPKHHTHTFHDGVTNPKILSISEDSIIFEATLLNRKGIWKQTIEVTYDFREIRKMLAVKIKQNEVEGLEQEQKRFQELKASVEELRSEQAPIVEEHKAKLEREKTITELCSNEGARVFFEKVQKSLRNKINVSGNIVTGDVERSRNTKKDYGVKGFRMITSFVPFGSAIGSAAGAAMDYGLDYKEKNRHTQLQDNVPLDDKEFCENIAIEFINQCPAIKQLNDARATKLVEKVTTIFSEVLKKDAIEGDVVQHVVGSIKKDSVFQKELKKLCDEQTKEETKQKAEVKAKQEARAKAEAKQEAEKAKAEAKQKAAQAKQAQAAAAKASTLVQFDAAAKKRKEEENAKATFKPLSPAALRAASSGASS